MACALQNPACMESGLRQCLDMNPLCYLEQPYAARCVMPSSNYCYVHACSVVYWLKSRVFLSLGIVVAG